MGYTLFKILLEFFDQIEFHICQAINPHSFTAHSSKHWLDICRVNGGISGDDKFAFDWFSVSISVKITVKIGINITKQFIL